MSISRVLLLNILLIGFLAPDKTSAQFAPAAGKAGTSAISYDSSCFVGWATGCKVVRGLRDISMPDSGFASVGDTNSAKGMAKQSGVLSLGDGGSATLSFKNPIMNGSGWDFAVFENTFLDTFLELAFVEVSSDGIHFVRFPAESLSDTVNQTAAFGATYPEKVNNLAGKYIVGYGTPFDLDELKDSANLDINNIRFVRVVDVVGSIQDAYASRDSKGRKINDPWPTLFASGGFDLDAVGVIHQNVSAKTTQLNQESAIHFWPNPSPGKIQIHIPEKTPIEIRDISGKLISTMHLEAGENVIDILLKPGVYSLNSIQSKYSATLIIQ